MCDGFLEQSCTKNFFTSQAWKEFTKDRESIILKLFYGQIKSTVTCIECARESITFDSFSNLSLELPTSSTRCSLSVRMSYIVVVNAHIFIYISIFFTGLPEFIFEWRENYRLEMPCM